MSSKDKLEHITIDNEHNDNEYDEQDELIWHEINLRKSCQDINFRKALTQYLTIMMALYVVAKYGDWWSLYLYWQETISKTESQINALAQSNHELIVSKFATLSLEDQANDDVDNQTAVNTIVHTDQATYAQRYMNDSDERIVEISNKNRGIFDKLVESHKAMFNSICDDIHQYIIDHGYFKKMQSRAFYERCSVEVMEDSENEEMFKSRISIDECNSLEDEYENDEDYELIDREDREYYFVNFKKKFIYFFSRVTACLSQ